MRKVREKGRYFFCRTFFTSTFSCKLSLDYFFLLQLKKGEATVGRKKVGEREEK